MGGWTEMGVDPSAFSQALCDEMKTIFVDSLSKPVDPSTCVVSSPDLDLPVDLDHTLPTPQQLLQKAYTNITTSNTIAAGGSTACIGIVSSQTGILATANLGDSGYAVYRRGKVVERSKVMTHAFNTPFQLTILPKEMRKREGEGEKKEKEDREVAKRTGRGGKKERKRSSSGSTRSSSSHHHILDYPEDSVMNKIQLEHGDLVVFSTDGFLDNVSATEALAIVNNTLVRHKVWQMSSSIAATAETATAETATSSCTPTTTTAATPTTTTTPTSTLIPTHLQISPTVISTLATKLVHAAYSASNDPNRITPFAKEVQREMRMPYYKGGKPDDITILALYVTDLEHNTP